jgi:SAM-dependent methyltransferase
VVDLGAGTGAQTRLLVDRARRVLAVEPDARMRSVLVDRLPGVIALDGRGEAIPVPDRSVDAVLASSSWHWMDPEPTLREVARVLVPGGTLGVVWSGPDPDGPFLAQAAALLSGGSDGAVGGTGTRAGDGDDDADGADDGTAGLRGAVLDTQRFHMVLEIPDGHPFTPVERHVHSWVVALTADELIGLLGTFSWVILQPDDRRRQIEAEARRLLRDALGIHGDVTIDVDYRAEAFRSRRLD